MGAHARAVAGGASGPTPGGRPRTSRARRGPRPGRAGGCVQHRPGDGARLLPVHRRPWARVRRRGRAGGGRAGVGRAAGRGRDQRDLRDVRDVPGGAEAALRAPHGAGPHRTERHVRRTALAPGRQPARRPGPGARRGRRLHRAPGGRPARPRSRRDRPGGARAGGRRRQARPPGRAGAARDRLRAARGDAPAADAADPRGEGHRPGRFQRGGGRVRGRGRRVHGPGRRAGGRPQGRSSRRAPS